jgi:hypothetical protein
MLNRAQSNFDRRELVSSSYVRRDSGRAERQREIRDYGVEEYSSDHWRQQEAHQQRRYHQQHASSPLQQLHASHNPQRNTGVLRDERRQTDRHSEYQVQDYSTLNRESSENRHRPGFINRSVPDQPLAEQQQQQQQQELSPPLQPLRSDVNQRR